MDVWQKIFCLHSGQVRRQFAADPLHLHRPRKRKFLSHFSQKAKKYQVGSGTTLMVELCTSETIHRLCGYTQYGWSDKQKRGSPPPHILPTTGNLT